MSESVSHTVCHSLTQSAIQFDSLKVSHSQSHGISDSLRSSTLPTHFSSYLLQLHGQDSPSIGHQCAEHKLEILSNCMKGFIKKKFLQHAVEVNQMSLCCRLFFCLHSKSKLIITKYYSLPEHFIFLLQSFHMHH